MTRAGVSSFKRPTRIQSGQRLKHIGHNTKWKGWDGTGAWNAKVVRDEVEHVPHGRTLRIAQNVEIVSHRPVRAALARRPHSGRYLLHR